MRLSLPAAPATALALSLLLALGLTSDAAHAAPSNLPDRPLDIDLKEADVANVFRLVAEVSGKNVVLDPCVHGKIDLRLKNAPIPLVYDALAMKLGLRYDEENGAVMVRCATSVAAAAPMPSPKLATRISVAESGTLLPAVLDHLAKSADLEGVDYRATAKPAIDMKLERVRVSTAMTALADAGGVKIALEKGRLIVTD